MREIIKMISKYNHHSGNSPQYIVIHDVGAVSSARNNALYFGGGNRRASAHYFVDDKETVQVVEEYNGAWHVGDGGGRYGIHNSNSIGIEQCLQPNKTISEATRKHTLELTKHLMAKYNIPASRVVRHYDASRKICPRAWSPNNWANWLRFKSDVLGNVATVKPPKTEVKTETKTKPKYKEEKFTVQQVTDVSLNIRTEPNTSSRVVRTLKPGTKFTPSLIVRNGEKVNDYTTWCKHPEGWVSMAYTTPVKVAKATKKLKGEDLPSKGSYKFTSNTNIRSGAGTNHGIVGLYRRGKTVHYDRKVVANGYVWLSYIGHSGYRRYVAVT
ncbi:N-acetylmuramoyl-L-alanine amidase [Enterococcus olivae]